MSTKIGVMFITLVNRSVIFAVAEILLAVYVNFMVLLVVSVRAPI